MTILRRDPGYRIREGSQILAERRREAERQEQVRQCQIRAGFAKYLDRRLGADRSKAA